MSFEAFITCAVTGSGDTVDKTTHLPVTPKEIADSSIAAAKAGAAVAHIHVRDGHGRPSRELKLYEEVVDRIRSSDTDVIINLTAGMGGDIIIGSSQKPLPLRESTDMVGADERLVHVEKLRPEICTLDCGTMNFSEGDYIMTNTPSILKDMAAKIQSLEVRPELEVFDTGHLVMVKHLLSEGLIDHPVLVQLCMGIPYGAPNDIHTFSSLIANLPTDWIFSAFSIGRMQLPFVAQAAIVGGNVRVGLEDNIYLEKGVLATNEQLVERARTILTSMNYRILSPDEVRGKLKLKKQF